MRFDFDGKSPKFLLGVLFALAAFMSVFSGPASARDFTAAETKDIEKIVRSYLLAHPEVLLEVMQELQTKQAAADSKDQAVALGKYRAELENDPSSFVTGNPKADVTIVEFFDYQCGYCKRAMQPLFDTIQKDGKVRLVLKEFPILSAESATASRAAIASIPQGKYLALHQALYHSKGQLTDAKIMSIADEVGIDTKRLAVDMKKPAIEQIIARNEKLAEALVIKGTPAFIINGKIYPGALGANELEAAIKLARNNKS